MIELDTHDERVLVLDFGSQVTQLIARRLRESGIYCEIWPFNADPERIAAWRRAPHPVRRPGQRHRPGQPRARRTIVWTMGVPVLGICYGQQLMCAQLGGAVEAQGMQEFGRAFVDVTGTAPCSTASGRRARASRSG